ncbi:MAG: virulence RhuM family protein [Marinilabiliaceae bacterium]|nr:virulence RhuM family protein [Marinilabiliaceae bacterium]
MKELSHISPTNKGEIILYQPDEKICIDVWVENDTVWLTQSQMGLLFERERSVITKHIKNVFKEGELNEESNVHFLHIAISDKPIKIYSLDVIISVGYRVKSLKGTAFRRWATSVLREYLLRGFVVNHRINHLETRMDQTEKKIDFILETILPIKEGEINKKINELVHYLEDIITDYNDINEDTLLQLEMKNETLADLHAKKKELDKPRPRIGYVQ